jgi:hypothetical protein
MAHDGHQIAVSACLCSQNAETVLGVVEGDPLDKACENFLSRWFRRWLHEGARIASSLIARHSTDAARAVYRAIPAALNGAY